MKKSDLTYFMLNNRMHVAIEIQDIDKNKSWFRINESGYLEGYDTVTDTWSECAVKHNVQESIIVGISSTFLNKTPIKSLEDLEKPKIILDISVKMKQSFN